MTTQTTLSMDDIDEKELNSPINSPRSNDSQLIEPVEDDSDDQNDIDDQNDDLDVDNPEEEVLTPRRYGQRKTLGLSPKSNRLEREVGSNINFGNVKIKIIAAFVCILIICFLFVIGYMIYRGSSDIYLKNMHNNADKVECELMNKYEIKNCSYECQCNEIKKCNECYSVQYKYYAKSIDKCGNDTILSQSSYDDCRNILRNTTSTSDCFITDCNYNEFRFEYEEQDIQQGIMWIVGACVLLCCPCFCLCWFVKQYLCYDIKRY